LRATDQRRAVITHDLVFGNSAIRAGPEFVSIIYLRRGHISVAFVLSVVDALEQSTPDVQPPLVVVAERRDTRFRVRARNEPPW
jgi:predicted nuclease of predicted toxin-antitoxin system